MRMEQVSIYTELSQTHTHTKVPLLLSLVIRHEQRVKVKGKQDLI